MIVEILKHMRSFKMWIIYVRKTEALVFQKSKGNININSH